MGPEAVSSQCPFQLFGVAGGTGGCCVAENSPIPRSAGALTGAGFLLPCGGFPCSRSPCENRSAGRRRRAHRQSERRSVDRGSRNGNPKFFNDFDEAAVFG